jgi:eukaryotic-like serine/threonine-protein kinase
MPEARPESELPLRKQQVDASRRNLGPDDPVTIQNELDLARRLVQSSRPDEASELLRHVVAIRTRDLGPDHPDTIMALSLSANVAKKLGRFDEARELHLTVLAWMEKQETVQPAELAQMLMITAHLFGQWRELERAAPYYQRAFDIRRETLGPDDPTLISQRWLALTRYRNGQPEIARELAEDAVERCRKSLGAESPETLRVQDLLTKMSQSG